MKNNKRINARDAKEMVNIKGGCIGNSFCKDFDALMLKPSAILQILIMIVSIIAFTYLVSQPLEITSATVNAGCCEKTTSSALCQNVLETECSEGFTSGVLCESTANCKLGCCVAPEGNCVVNTPKRSCEEEGGVWHDSENCNFLECQRGCCVLGIQTQFITEKECETISKFYGLEKDFRREMSTELQCLALSYQAQEAACVFTMNEQETCQYKTQQECNKIGGRIELGKYCSDILTTCQKHFEKKCVSGKDPVYWFDSCGNKEDIAEQCDRFTGTTCGYDNQGEAYCQDLDCHNIPDKTNGGRAERKNGESWCVYEAYVGDGKDVPGTSHYKYYCIDGGVVQQGCKEGRAEICAENEVTKDDGTKFSQASCVPNNALSCINLNIQKFDGEITEDEHAEQCKNNSFCRLHGISGGDLNPKLALCAPKYPLGLTNPDDAAFICNFGTYKCTKYETKEWGDWDCEAGCDCGDDSTKKIVNEWCASLGDCGIQTNIEGVVTYGGFRITKDKDEKTDSLFRKKKESHEKSTVSNPDLSSLSKYKNPIPGQKILTADIISDIAALLGELSLPEGGGTPEENLWFEEIWGGVLGLGGLSALGGALLAGGLTKAAFLEWLIFETPGFWSNAFYFVFATTMGMLFGYLVGQIFGSTVGPETINVLTTIGTLGGILTGIAGMPGVEAAAWQVAVTFIVIILVIAFMSSIFGTGERTTTYTYTCKAWEPPKGGDDCALCNSKYNETCTAYKCWSLGTACKYDRQAGRCYKEVDDGKVPIINPWTSIIESSGFNIVETTASGIRINKTDTWNGCINQYEQVTLGITTHEESVCKYDFSSKSFDDMIYDFDNNWNTNHSITRSFSVLEEGEQSIYIKCSDRQGHDNDVDYIIKTCINELDVRAPAIISSSPLTNSYIKYKEDKVNLTIFLDEPSECKWSKVDKAFESMENNITCPLIETMYLWPCNTQISGLTQESNDIYIRCKDRVGAPDSERNTNTQGMKFTFLKTQNPLIINIISPLKDSEITFGDIVDIELKVETSGGAEGNSLCKYGFTGYSTMTQFFETGTTEHIQHFNLLGEGKHKIYIECIDAAGNEAKNLTEFSVKFDRQPPKITRVYKKDNNLYIETDEDSTCAYSDRTCNFNFEDAIQMTGIENEHYIEWKAGKTYYIKCKDLWGNYADGCNMLIHTI